MPVAMTALFLSSPHLSASGAFLFDAAVWAYLFVTPAFLFVSAHF
jgi:hypothetical protein